MWPWVELAGTFWFSVRLHRRDPVLPWLWFALGNLRTFAEGVFTGSPWLCVSSLIVAYVMLRVARHEGKRPVVLP